MQIEETDFDRMTHSFVGYKNDFFNEIPAICEMQTERPINFEKERTAALLLLLPHLSGGKIKVSKSAPFNELDFLESILKFNF